MTTPTTPTTPATPRPALTPAERKAALAWIERDGASLRDVAAQLALAADELLDILTQPHVATFIEAAENIIHVRERILTRYDDIEARQSLVAIAKNPEADPTTRLRAAITILQGPPPRRSALQAPTNTPTVPGGPGNPTVPGGSRPDRCTSSRSTPAPPGAPPANIQPARVSPVSANGSAAEAPAPTPASNTPARINRAAAAPLAHHDRIAAEAPIHIPRPASPATSGRPP